MDPKCLLTSTDLQTRRARCQHQLSFLFVFRPRGLVLLQSLNFFINYYYYYYYYYSTASILVALAL